MSLATEGDEPTESFVVRVWLEREREGSRPAAWRGHVTHVAGGERRYVHALDEIGAFILPYLERMGVRPVIHWRLRRWLRWMA